MTGINKLAGIITFIQNLSDQLGKKKIDINIGARALSRSILK